MVVGRRAAVAVCDPKDLAHFCEGLRAAGLSLFYRLKGLWERERRSGASWPSAAFCFCVLRLRAMAIARRRAQQAT